MVEVSSNTFVLFRIFVSGNKPKYKANHFSGRGRKMGCRTKDELEQHLSDIRTLAVRPNLTPEEREAAVRAERFAIGLLQQHDTSRHDGKQCPFATPFATRL
jgi:hypothetical protein